MMLILGKIGASIPPGFYALRGGRQKEKSYSVICGLNTAIENGMFQQRVNLTNVNWGYFFTKQKSQQSSPAISVLFRNN